MIEKSYEKVGFEGQNLEKDRRKISVFFIPLLADYYMAIYTVILTNRIENVLGDITKITKFNYVCPLATDQHYSARFPALPAHPLLPLIRSPSGKLIL